MNTAPRIAPALALVLALAGCNAVSDDKLSVAEAQHWLQETCGVRLAKPLQLVGGHWLKASGSQGWHVRVTANLHIEGDEVEGIVRQLRDNKGLNQRGATATHYSFESPTSDHAERACEIDAPTGRFYFQYVD